MRRCDLNSDAISSGRYDKFPPGSFSSASNGWTHWCRRGGLLGSVILLFLIICPRAAWPERIFFAGYKGGFYIRSEEEGGMALRLGGAFQADYRHYLEEERADNRFDIRRARLRFNGDLTRWVRYGLEYEFQGNETSNLVDAYAELGKVPASLRMGQFKEPFSLEWQTRDKGLFFAERSFAYSLGPGRDIGLMLHGTIWDGRFTYALGAFNGDGPDGSTRGTESDAPEGAARLVLAPFKAGGPGWLQNLQLGGSGTYGAIDTANISLNVKSTGMYGSSRSLYRLSHDTKFGVLQDVDSLWRLGLEAFWSYGPVALTGEVVHLRFSGLKPAGETAQDADFRAGYLSAMWALTGEPFILSRGVVQPLYPHRFFDPESGTWGAFVLAARVDHFEGDEDWITSGAHVSVRRADTYSLAFNWLLFPMVRVVLDLSHTDMSDRIRVRVRPDGTVDYVDEENVATLRMSLDF
jgi:phosphate-selective porin OprO and OprP